MLNKTTVLAAIAIAASAAVIASAPSANAAATCGNRVTAFGDARGTGNGAPERLCPRAIERAETAWRNAVRNRYGGTYLLGARRSVTRSVRPGRVQRREICIVQISAQPCTANIVAPRPGPPPRPRIP